MSLLSAFQRVADELGHPRITQVIGSSNATVRRMLALVYRVGDELILSNRWGELEKEALITLQDGVSLYQLPTDFNYQLVRTTWAVEEGWPLIGPISAAEQQARAYGVGANEFRQHFRLTGARNGQFFIDPTPDSGDAGNEISFRYQSKQWFKPQTWAQGVAFPASSYCSYDGNIYSTVSGGAAGATPPTHTDSTPTSDGNVTWTYSSSGYLELLADTDEFIVDQSMVEADLKWRLQRSFGLPYLDLKAESEKMVKLKASNIKKGRVLNLSRRTTGARFLSSDDIPDTGYGS
jgi:hypothetical protein